MAVRYLIKIEQPETHYVKVSMKGTAPSGAYFDVCLPSWSPGSYLMREYGRHIRGFRALDQSGAYLKFEQMEKGTYRIWPETSAPKNREYEIQYDVYCHEVSVRNSYVDTTHAFLHLPTLLMTTVGTDNISPQLELSFPALWSKISTGLTDVSTGRECFLYTAANYDDLIDCPIEIGCHETDGFMVKGIPHELAFYGNSWPHGQNLKKDIETIVSHIAGAMGEIPYSRYVFITHFANGIYGGLEHKNSTALHFDGTRLAERKSYVKWMCLVSHEYFHTWNVKRIRPKELGPFNYRQEAYTKLLWLAEGLTSFMDELYVYRAGLISLEEYLDLQKSNIKSLLATPGRNFHSLDESSFNAWIKLYRPDENSANSSVSYYLKGGVVFFLLNILLKEKGRSIDDLLQGLWYFYKKRPEQGMDEQEVYHLVGEIGGPDVLGKFQTYVQTTEELPLKSALAAMGIEMVEESQSMTYIGIKIRGEGERVFVQSVILDGPAYKCGLNAGDEILAINDARVLRSDWEDLNKNLLPHKSYQLLLSRLGKTMSLSLQTAAMPAEVKELKIVDRQKATQILGGPKA